MDSSKIPGGDANDPSKANHVPSTSELMASAKVVAEATRAKMNNQEYDQNKAAAAAAVVLNAASHYGKLDESTGLGKLLDKAEDYLHSYSTTKTTTTTHGGGGHGNTVTTHETTTQTSGNPKEDGEHGIFGGGGYGEYVKMAQGLLNKGDNTAHGGDAAAAAAGGGGGGGGGYGDYVKMAGDFLKK